MTTNTTHYEGNVFDQRASKGTRVAAVVSHVATGDPAHVAAPLMMVGLVVASYVLRWRVAAEGT